MIPQAVATNGLAATSPSAAMASCGYVCPVLAVVAFSRDHVFIEFWEVNDVDVALELLDAIAVELAEVPHAVALLELNDVEVALLEVGGIDVGLAELADMRCEACCDAVGDVIVGLSDVDAVEVSCREIGIHGVGLDDVESDGVTFEEREEISLGLEELS